MNFKSKLGILILGLVVIGSSLFLFLQKEPYSTELVIDSLWVKYEDEVQSTQGPGEDFQIIDVSVYDEKDIAKIKSYLRDNLSEEDLIEYQLNVYEWSSNPQELRQNAMENLDSDDK